MSVVDLTALSWDSWQPLQLDVDGQALQLESCLRLLPGKRVAARACFRGERVFAKVFFAAGHEREAAAEKQVIEQVAACGVPVAALKGHYAGDGFSVVMQRWLPDLSPLSQVNEATLMTSVTAVLEVLHKLRAAGLCQRDPHLANFARSDDGELYFLDAGDVVSCGTGSDRRFLDSLALFCAQVPAGWLVPVIESAAAFFAPEVTLASLTRRVDRLNRKRIRHALKKWLRACTAIMPFSGADFRGWLDRTHAPAQAEILDLLQNPERLPLIKRGSRIAVYGDAQWVLKCYRDTSWRSRAKRRFNLSSARRSWRMGWTLDMLGLPTPRPVALLEKPDGEAVLLFPTVAAERFSEVLEQDPARATSIAAAIRRSIAAMGRLGLWHGDMKAQNILVAESRHSLIDLDAAGWSALALYARRRHQRDAERFEQNWSQFTPNTTEDASA